MADNVAITAGSGTTVGTDERSIASTNVHVQRVSAEGGTSIANGQVAVTASAATLVAARETRLNVTIINACNVDVYIGVATVTTANGVKLVPGAGITIPANVLIQQIASSVTGLVGSTHYIESYA